MSAYIIKQTRKYHQSSLVSKANRNVADMKKKPDILLYKDGKPIYLDIGITKRMKQYYEVKTTKYLKSDIQVIPIIFGKNCTIHPESLKFLTSLKGIKENELYEKLGTLLGQHYEQCLKRHANLNAQK